MHLVGGNLIEHTPIPWVFDSMVAQPETIDNAKSKQLTLLCINT